MMANLMDEDVGDDRCQRLVVLCPVIEDRPPVEPNHIGKLPSQRNGGRLGAPSSAKEAQNVEFALAIEGSEGFAVRKILDPDDEAFAKSAELPGQSGKGRIGQLLNLGERGGL